MLIPPGLRSTFMRSEELLMLKHKVSYHLIDQFIHFIMLRTSNEMLICSN